MGKSNLTKCKACGNEISAKGKVTCPSCGMVNKQPFYKRGWFVVLAIIVVLAVIGNLGDKDDSTVQNASISDEASADSSTDIKKIEEKTEEKAEEKTVVEETKDDNNASEEIVNEVLLNLIYDGVYKVGTDIQPGLYKVDVNESSMGMGYIDRAKDATMEMDSIIANIIIFNSGYVRIKDTDAFVKIQGATLSPEDTIVKNIKTVIEDGIYLIGVDLEPGTYKVEVTDTTMNMGYVERLSDVSMDMKDIIANELFQNQGYVEILSSDYAVRLQGAKITKTE